MSVLESAPPARTIPGRGYPNQGTRIEKKEAYMKAKRKLSVEILESRALPSGLFQGIQNLFAGTSTAVQADLAKIRTDLQTLRTDTMNLAPTLQKDAQAIATARQTAR